MKKLVSVLLVAVLTMAMVLSVSAAGPKVTKDEETGITSLQLLNCDEKPDGNNGYEVDTENAQEGTGCLSFVAAKGAVHVMLPADTIDGTGYDTLEFDLYVSDVALFDLFGGQGMNSGFEITSSGACDNQEISWKLAEIKEHHQGEELVVGWNHIILPLSTAVEREAGGNDPSINGPFDISKINYLRFFMVNEPEDHDIIVKLDNICLTDRIAAKEAAEKEAAAKKTGEKFNEDVKKLEDMTAENYTSFKTKLISLRKRYDKMAEDAKKYVTEEAVKMLADGEAKYAEYEANPPAEQPEEQKGSGCGATITLGGIAMLALAGAVVLRKKED